MGTNSGTKTSDGSTASYYELPPDATELQHLIAYKNMNAQMGEIFRANYRYGEVSHSDKLREINKILFYAHAEKERLLKYEYQGGVEASEELPRVQEQAGKVGRILREGAAGASAGTREFTTAKGASPEAPASESKSSYVQRAEAEAERKNKLAMQDSASTYKEFSSKHEEGN